jgi:hypothetical protein
MSEQSSIRGPVWVPAFMDGDGPGRGWRAKTGSVVDGRLWDSRELCQAYCDGLHQGWLDRSRS